MIEKGKNLQFYSWVREGESITVVGTRLPEKPLTFSFFLGKEQLNDTDSSIVTDFVTELKESMSKTKSKNAKNNPKKVARRPRRVPRRR
jgi:hypothetical protein